METQLKNADHPGFGNEESGVQKEVALPDMVVREIVRGIHRGHYAPGQKLIESDLIKRFGFSRGSIREAIRRLAAEGVVTLELHRGAYVRSLSKEELLDVLAVSCALNALAAKTAAQKIHIGDNREKLERWISGLRSQDLDAGFASLSQIRDSFFRVIVDIADNKELSSSLRRLHLPIARVSVRSVENLDRVRSWKKIAEAILSGDARKAENRMKAHIEKSIEIFSRQPEDFFG